MVKAGVSAGQSLTVFTLSADVNPHSSQAINWSSVAACCEEQETLLLVLWHLMNYLPKPLALRALLCEAIDVLASRLKSFEVKLLGSTHKLL